ncbi:MAG TPA: hypothetical protein PKE63_14425 [Lacibacter sp.]|nr:hypothetical protein [Lacibacter sp.]HMO87546.1 hypothetical protein [Lacibacter sp.]HMP88472.1 hypothetical protein [Lacibacter sp.]
MKLILLIPFLLLCLQQLPAQQPPAEQIQPYWFVLLKKGPNRGQDSATAAALQRGHMANINRLYSEGMLKVAGPFGDGGDWLGIFIFDASAPGCSTRANIERLLQTDPAVAAGRLNYEIRTWYTSPEGSFKPGTPDKKY